MNANLILWRKIVSAHLLALASLILISGSTVSELHAQIPTVLYNFGANPGDPVIPGFSGLVQGRDGNMYATTEGGGIMDYGTVIKLTPSGTLAVLYKFDNAHGIYPNGISLGTDGNFYGATNSGGTMGKGTIYQITPSGALTTLYSFTGGGDGGFPAAGPILAVNGNLYGPSGPLYQLTLGGQFTTIYSGTSAPLAPFLQASDGHFYGTDYVAGANGAGQVFKVSVSGVYTILHGFMQTDGENPQAALIQGNDGKFYGSTYNLANGGKGTIFSITSSGNFKLLHRFGGPEGAQPVAALLQGPDGNFYGGTYSGGTGNAGRFSN